MNEDRSSRYHRLQRRASVAAAALAGAFLLVFLVSGASAALRDAAASWSGGSFAATLLIYSTVLFLAHAALELPLAVYSGLTLERRYGLSAQTTGGWWRDHVKAGAVALVFSSGAALVVYALIRWRPDTWWLIAALAFAAIIVVLAQLAPVVLLPLFYELKPLDRPALAERLVSLAERAGARVLGVFEWRLSSRTRRANAALAGLGPTRRILLSDTLLAEYSDDEVEVILAHELAHHVYRDIWTAIALESALVVLGFFLADRALEIWSSSFGLQGKGDIAGLPLLALAGGAVSIALRPAANALSRAHERRADRYALEMTRNAGAFIRAMRRLSAQNLAEERPSRLVEVLFHTHPP
ncbi:MAG TPA: M48 family metalloprotease, partial [Vicinamibacterales bacterium]|nr:M48 family metalloprotease [Vicinamibacterales bacterium]